MSRGTLNARWAATLIEGLSRSGVTQAVLSPGSRSSPLVLACDAYLNTKMLVDERSAAFFALGCAKITAQPVVLVCTSGTATANWYPAVMEASYARIPLILLTADRPPESLGFGANQTVDQIKMFGNLTRLYYGLPPPDFSALKSLATLAAQAVEKSLWPLPGPVHINVPFREPLLPGQDIAPITKLPPTPFVTAPLSPNPQVMQRIVAQIAGHPGLIVCGELQYDTQLATAIVELAATLDCPILADPLSNLRCGSHHLGHVMCHYDTWLLHDDLALKWQPRWLIHFGTTPVSKRLSKFLAHIKLPTYIAVNDQGLWSDPQHLVTRMVRANPLIFCSYLSNIIKDQQTNNSWKQTLIPLETAAVELLDGTNIPLEWTIIRQVIAALPSPATLFIGNSMPIRDLDACMGSGPKELRILANRGASGIDGTISTLAGVAASSQNITIGIIGDLALFHDLNGLYSLQEPNVILIVMNNEGGGIFHYLSQAKLPTFTKYWLTPTVFDISKIAAAFQLNYMLANSEETMMEAFTRALNLGQPSLIEVKIDSKNSVDLHRKYWAMVTTN
ncbi:hypothetical protein TI04_05225 [Achromatium sp. WMS2]|nr:hypothetical protein TI04_05225 [Achromatium sp. WMS2]